MEQAGLPPGTMPEQRSPPVTRSGGWEFARVAALAILLLPFAYYAFVLATRLVPSHYPDTFAYIWRGKLNWHFLSGRSLTQRLLFSLSNRSNPGIGAIQLVFLLGTELGLYGLLRSRRALPDLLLAGAIAFVFSSYSLNVCAAEICAEVVFVALMLLFPVVLMRSRRPLAVVGVGALYVFSKNSAPYCAMLLVACAAALRHPRPVRIGRAWIAVCVLAVASIAIMRSFDTSVQLNVVDNACTRIFSRPEVARLFHERYGMPVGPFVTACAAGNVTTPCFDGESLLTTDTAARNYVLREDRYGFVRWARSRGMRAYVSYLFFDDPLWTAREFSRAFEAHFADGTVEFLVTYLDVFPSGPLRSNLARLAGGSAARRRGFFGFDPLAAIRTGVGALGFGSLLGLASWVIAALALHLHRRSDGVTLALVLLGNALGQFFLGYFGAGMEWERHLAPAVIGYVLGAAVLVMAVVSRIVSEWIPRPG